MATVVMYLSDIEEGGETVFKAEGKDGEHCGFIGRVVSSLRKGNCVQMKI